MLWARVLPALLLGLCLDGFGQMIGYAVGSGTAIKKLARYEFNRLDYLTPADRDQILSSI